MHHLRRDGKVNSASHQTRTTLTFFSCLCHTAVMRTSHASSLVRRIVILGPRCHVTLCRRWVCVLFILLHTSVLVVPLFIRLVTELNYHCRSAQRRVWPTGRLDLKHRFWAQRRRQPPDGFHHDLRPGGRLPRKCITECFRAGPAWKIQKQQPQVSSWHGTDGVWF